jgi:hypothetical protein
LANGTASLVAKRMFTRVCLLSLQKSILGD